MTKKVERRRSEDVSDYKGYWICDDGNIIDRFEATIIPVYASGVIKLLNKHTNRKDAVVAHRLIAQVFLDNPKKYGFVRSIDGNPTNRAVDNLEWVLSTRKVSEESLEIVAMRQLGLTVTELAYMFKKTPQYMHRVLKDHKKRLED